MRFDSATTENALVKRLAADQTALCMAIRVSRTTHVLHMAKAAAIDSIYVDMEHSTVGLENAAQLCLAAAGIGVTPLVRVPSHDPYWMGRVLEGGAQGVIVPHVDTVAQAKAVVDTALFKPYGHRAMAGGNVAISYAPIGSNEAGKRLNNSTIVIVMLESNTAIANAEAIAAIEGIDMLFIGAGDLSEELGVHGEPEHPKIRAAFEAAAAACRKHRKWLGVAGIKGESPVLPELYRMGARFLSVKNDESLLTAATRQEGKLMRGYFKG